MKNISKIGTYADAYSKMFKDEILWVGIKWKLSKGKDMYIKPLREA
ncbi:MAG: hypothetical protein HC831_14800 [Chloroflexia bacterium]|nr:hypothetical protein [Chloroflexia bacterium]